MIKLYISDPLFLTRRNDKFWITNNQSSQKPTTTETDNSFLEPQPSGMNRIDQTLRELRIIPITK